MNPRRAASDEGDVPANPPGFRWYMAALLSIAGISGASGGVSFVTQQSQAEDIAVIKTLIDQQARTLQKIEVSLSEEQTKKIEGIVARMVQASALR